MKKISGKALSLVLSLALVVSSFSTTFASASTTHTVSGTLSDTDKDVVYAVNGETTDAALVVDSDIQSYIFGTKDQTLETADHQHTVAAKISAVSHASGDRLVKWFDTSDKGSINDDTSSVTLQLRSKSASGHEVLNVLYKGTYTDDNDNTVAVKATKSFDVYVYDNGQPIIADVSKVGSGDVNARKDTVALTDSFAQKLLSAALDKTAPQDNKTLAVYQATTDNNSTVIQWNSLPTIFKGDTAPASGTYYTLKSSSNAVNLTHASSNGTPVNGVTATVSGNSTGTVTFTATVQDAKDTASLSTTKDLTAKATINKEIKVDVVGYGQLSKYSGNTYIAKDTATVDADAVKDSNAPLKATGYEVNYAKINGVSYADVSVQDKATVTKISGAIQKLDITSGTVGSVALSDDYATVVGVTDAKVGNIDFGDKNGTLNVDSTKASVGDVTDATDVTVTSGTVGNITTTSSGTVTVKADDTDTGTVVGNVKTHSLTVDSEDSKVSIGTVKASDDSAEFDLSGSSVSIKGFDFDNRNATISTDDFQGSIPAPVNASQDGATISTTNADDKVEVVGNVNIDAVSIEDESTLTFDGKVNASTIDGSGTLVIGAGNLYVDGSVADTTLKLANPNFAKGTVVFTALADAVNPDDFNTFGFTLAKTSGSKVDTFTVDSLVFSGLAVNKASSEIANGYSETFTAGSYPAGLSIPSGYTVQWDLSDANDQIFSLTTNADGSATVKVVGYDTQFASENKATLEAQLVDANGDVDTDYAAGTASLPALAVPATNYKSDTTGTVNIKVGGSYQFKITSTDGSVPTFVVAGNGGAAVTATAKSGNDYFYKVTGLKAGDYGVYVNGTTRTAVLHITSDATIDSSVVTIKAGSTYQFKVTSSAKPVFGLGSGSAVLASSSVSGNNYFFKVKAAGKAGDKVGVYVNGARLAVITVG